MSQTFIFRTLIIVSIITYVSWTAIPFFDVPYHSERTLNLLSYSGSDALIIVPNYILWFIFSLWIILSIAIFNYWQYARVTYLVMLVISFFFVFISGLSIQTPVEILFVSITNILDGAIIAMAYFSQVSNQFLKNLGS